MRLRSLLTALLNRFRVKSQDWGRHRCGLVRDTFSISKIMISSDRHVGREVDQMDSK